jgi:hypothetical protein
MIAAIGHNTEVLVTGRFMSAIRRVRRSVENPAQAPLQFWWLIDELKKKKIPQSKFAKRLGVTTAVLTGRSGVFPADKVEECLQLLANWDEAPAPTAPGGVKGANHPWVGSALASGRKF